MSRDMNQPLREKAAEFVSACETLLAVTFRGRILRSFTLKEETHLRPRIRCLVSCRCNISFLSAVHENFFVLIF